MNIQIHKLGGRIFHWLARAVQLQLFLTLFSLPIFVAWGLPFSLMSPLGNILFTPFLTLFLLLASFIFCAELLHIPYSPCTFLLNHLTTAWLHLMNYGSMEWLTGVAQLPSALLLCIAIISIGIMSNRHTCSIYRSIFCFILLLLGIIGYTRFMHQAYTISTISYARSHLTLMTTPTKTILVDPGCLGSNIASASWTRYTLVPELIKRGITCLDHVIMLQPKGFGFAALEQLCCALPTRFLHIPYWQGTMNASHNVRYNNLIRVVCATGTTLIRIANNQDTLISRSDDHTILIAPESHIIKTGNITYAAFTCYAQIDNKKVTLYSSQ